jgi:hypothetical protein
LQLRAPAYTVANLLRTVTLPPEVTQWSITTLRDRRAKIGARIVRHARVQNDVQPVSATG